MLVFQMEEKKQHQNKQYLGESDQRPVTRRWVQHDLLKYTLVYFLWGHHVGCLSHKYLLTRYYNLLSGMAISRYIGKTTGEVWSHVTLVDHNYRTEAGRHRYIKVKRRHLLSMWCVVALRFAWEEMTSRSRCHDGSRVITTRCDKHFYE
jgi:hypothetical protein